MPTPSQDLKKKKKRCTLCLRTKPLSDFYGNACATDGLSTRCKHCAISRSMEIRYGSLASEFKLEKRCTHCNIIKPATDFYAKDRGVLGVAPECKKCAVVRNQRWRKSPGIRERQIDQEKARRTRLRDTVISAYGGYRCACCGETEKLFLSLDHINNDGGEWRRKTFGKRDMAGYRTYYWLVAHKFPAGFQVLCGNCQFGKRMNGGVCPHSSKV